MKKKEKEKCLDVRVRRPPAPMHRPPRTSLIYIYVYIYILYVYIYIYVYI